MYLYFQLRTHKNLFNAEAAIVQEPETEEAEPAMSPWSAGAVLIATTLVIAVCAEYLVDSIDDLVETAHISKNFIGLILIPIVGNAAEHVTACVVAVRNKMDLVSCPLHLLFDRSLNYRCRADNCERRPWASP
jgi:Ca2+:H+ antiporter